MPGAVTSGLGRNGPWLQNDWLRIESRQDDGSISPIALNGAFRPTERALASVEIVGATPLAFARSDYDIQPHEDALGRGRRLTLTSPLPRRGVVLQREIVLYDGHPFAVVRAGVTPTGQPLRIAAIHAFTTPAEGRSRLQLAAPPDGWRIYRNGWQSWSPTMSFGGAQRDVRSAPPVLAPEPPERDPGRFASDDVGLLFDPASARAMLAGAATARDFISQVIVDASRRSFDARNLTDDIALAPGDTLWSERFLIDVCGHPNEQLARYGDALGRLMGARVPSPTPSGWCSWYYFYQDVTEADVIRNLRFLEQHRRELPIETVQIDDGYQADVGDWLTVNDKFPRGMASLAAEIKRAGYTPGIWLAPFLLASTSQTFAEHPDWVVRTSDGSPALAMDNWGHANHGLDGTHPDVQAWLTALFRAVCDGWGYDYVKIDFLFAAAIAGLRHDPGATRIHAYRRALDAVRAGVGPDRFILGCGSLMAPSVGYFDGNRIGLDVAPFWRFMTRDERERPEGRPRTPDDILSAEGAVRNTLNRTWMHGRLWANDPDCLLVRTDRTKLTIEETRTLATVIGLTAGMMLSSDDLERVPSGRLDLISMLLPVLQHPATPRDLLDRDMPERLELVVDRAYDPLRVIALTNYDDTARDLALELPPGAWHVFELWEERYRGVHEGRVTLDLIAPHDSRIVALRPADGQARVVGATAHIGCGALDLLDQSWDEASGALTITVGPAGRRSRRVSVWTGGREATVEVAGRTLAVEASGDIRSVALEIDAPTEVTWRLDPR